VRIFPMYYATLLGIYLINFFSPYTSPNLRGLPDRVLWHASYLSNYFFSYVYDFRRDIKAPPDRHFWSLAVEEQFYLCWPFVILLLPRRALYVLLALCIFGAPFYRFLMYVPKSHAHEWMTPACLDLLAAGALLAVMYRVLERSTVRKILFAAGVVGALAMTASIGADVYQVAGRTGDYLRYSAIAVFGFWLIGWAAMGFRGPMGWVLANPVSTYFGKISYGMYVFHPFTPYIVRYVLWYKMGINPTGYDFSLAALCFAVTFVWAALSWHFFESPFNNLNRFFTYRKTEPKAA
jgi:peptidoglycan/LPS O-acetylase OafA/YrhL